MALFGFAINFKNGSTDYVIISAADQAQAERDTLSAANSCGVPVDSLEVIDAEDLIDSQYNGCAVLSTELGGC